LSTRRAGARPGAAPPAGGTVAGVCAEAGAAPPATAATTAAARRVLRDGCSALLMGGGPPRCRVGAGPCGAGRTACVHRLERVCAHYEHSGTDLASTPAGAAPTSIGLDQWRA